MDSRRHVLIVAFPVQGNINPSLRFAERLIATGTKVTFATTVFARHLMAKTTGADVANGLTHASFSDGYDDDGFNPTRDDPTTYMTTMRTRGSKALNDIIDESDEQGRPVTRVVYTLLLPWAADVAKERHLPCTLLWIQPATVLDIYYYYFHGYSDRIVSSSDDDPSWGIEFPGIPLTFSERDLPSFLLPSSSSDMDAVVLRSFEEHLEALDSDTLTKPRVLVNTFDALEADALGAIEKYELIGIGPLIPLYEKATDHDEWLDSKAEGSVVYVAFGSVVSLGERQMEEIAKGLRDSGRPFLWVIRETDQDSKKLLSYLEGVEEERGKIVAWCSQLEVLRHRSLGCFVTHCGWNSTLESISCGVPVVAFPQWTDQWTNAKLIEDVWRNGVRVRGKEDDGVVERGEIRRCIEEVMDGGQRSRELRESAGKWKALAAVAMGENGSSHRNLEAFLA